MKTKVNLIGGWRVTPEVTGIDYLVSTGKVILVVYFVPALLLAGCFVVGAISLSIAKFLDSLK